MHRPLLVAALLVLSPSALAVPSQLVVQGRLFDTHGPVDGVHALTVAIHTAPQGGARLGVQTSNVLFEDGSYVVLIGRAGQDPVDLPEGPLFLELSIDGGPPLGARRPLASAPYAFEAWSVEGGPVDALEIAVGGQPVVDSEGRWVGEPLSYQELLDAPLATLDALTCATEQVPLWDGGLWTCVDLPVDTTLSPIQVLQIIDGSGYARVDQLFGGSWYDLTDVPADADTLAGLSCYDGQVAVFDEPLDAWVCDDLPEASLSAQAIAEAGLATLEDLLTIAYDDLVGLPELFSGSWLDLTDVPADLLDGDDGVPIGTIIDWWAPPGGAPLPDGYVLCNGDLISDPRSPWIGTPTPDLRDRFTMGVDGTGRIGEEGGAASHGHAVDLDHDHASVDSTAHAGHTHTVDVPAFTATGTTGSGGGHDHTVSIDHDHGSVNTDAKGAHNHQWSRFTSGSYVWYTYNSSGNEIVAMDWGNGLSSDGGGSYPFNSQGDATGSFYTKGVDNHTHAVDLPNYDVDNRTTSFASAHTHSMSLSVNPPATTSTSSGAHTHAVDLPAFGTLDRATTEADSRPPYVGVLKLIKVF